MSGITTKVRCVDKTDEPDGQFDSYHRLHSRLHGSIVVFNGPTFRTPVSIVGVSETHWAFDLCDPNTHDKVATTLGCPPSRIPVPVFMENYTKWISPIKSVGYVNTFDPKKNRDMVVFLSRIPSRTFSIGLTPSNTSMARLDQGSTGELRLGRWLWAGIADMVHGKYPVLHKVLHHEDPIDRALSKDVAISLYDDDLGQWKVFFRQHLIGFIREVPYGISFKGLPFVRKNGLYAAELNRLGILQG